jgi:hypothetical protein
VCVCVCVCVHVCLYKEIYHKELAHVIMEFDKSQNLQAATWRLGRLMCSSSLSLKA